MSFLKVPVFGAEPYGFKATDVSGCRAWFDAADVTTLYSTLPVTGMLGFTDYASADIPVPTRGPRALAGPPPA